MAPRIIEFLDRYKSRPFQWGVDDCSLFIADWWRENHGVDPASELRGTYSSEEQKSEIVADAGGLLKLVTGIADGVGAKRASTPETGCFALIEPGVCAIYAQGYWVVRSDEGLTFSQNARVLRMWSI